MNKLKKGDIVKILLGKDRGASGKILKYWPKKRQVLVEGLNKVKRHVGKKVTGNEGGIIEVSKPVDISNVVLICPSCKKLTRVMFKLDGKVKIRVCRKCGKEIK